MKSSAPIQRGDTFFRIVLSLPAVLAFAVRYVPYTFPPQDEVRQVLNVAQLDHLATLVLTALLLIASLGVGTVLIRQLRVAGGAIYAVGLGLGAYALAVFLVGQFIISPYVFLAMLVVPLAVFGGTIRQELVTLHHRVQIFFHNRSLLLSLLVLAVMLVFILNIVRAFIPSWDYDVLEYHLGSPAEWWGNGRIVFLPHNVYAAFPFNMEMLYLMAIGLKGNLITAVSMAQVINVAVGLLAALAAGALAQKISVSALSGILAGAAFYVFPWTSQLSTNAYNESGMIFFALLALAALIDSIHLHEPRSIVLAGIFAGLSFGCKYPAAVFLIIPCALFLVFGYGMLGRWKTGLYHALMFGTIAVAVASPWLVRNAVDTGNPVYPLMYEVFGGRYFSPEQNAKWHAAHSPKGFGSAALHDAFVRFLHEPEVRYVEVINGLPDVRTAGSALIWLPVVVAIGFLSRRSTTALVLVGYVGVCFIIWFLFTHRIARFMAPWAMVALVPASVSAMRGIAWNRIASHVTIGASIVLLTLFSLRARNPNLEAFIALGFLDERVVLSEISARTNSSYDAMLAINDLPQGSRVLLVGEAQTYYLTTDFVFATVFDRNPLEDMLHIFESAEEVHAGLKREGITHIYVNVLEAIRLRWSYAFEFEGQHIPGYWALSDSGWRNFEQLISRFCTLEQEFGGPIPIHRLAEDDRQLFPAFTGGRLTEVRRIIDGVEQREPALPASHYIYRLK